MPRNTRNVNQYYGKYFECCVNSILNNTPIDFKEDYAFSEKEKEIFYAHAKIVADYIGDHSSTYVGNLTCSATGDLMLDNGETVELKYVSNGNGTYHNTSIYYLQKFGFDFKQYMIDFGLLQTLEELFGDVYKISRTNKSPVNQATSSAIRDNYEDLYNEKIVPIDYQLRKTLTEDVYNYFMNNPEQAQIFLNDMINKVTLRTTSTKTKPDHLIVFNYDKETISEIDCNSFKSDSIDPETTYKSDLGFVLNGIRFAFSWQNGAGLYNPTIRVFV